MVRFKGLVVRRCYSRRRQRIGDKNMRMIRKMDELGRIVIPMETRRVLRIAEKDPLEIFTEDDGTIILKKYTANQSCMVTGEVKPDIIELYGGKIRVSREIARELIYALNMELERK